LDRRDRTKIVTAVAPVEPDVEDVVGDPGEPRRHPVGGRVLDALAALLIFVGLVLPNDLSRLKPAALLTIPVEGLLAAILLLLLPAKFRRVVATVLGAMLGLVMLLKIMDMGFLEALGRPFNPMVDWSLLVDGLHFIRGWLGQAGAIGAVALAVLVVAAVPTLTALSARRLARVLDRHSVLSSRAVAVLAIVWVSCAVPGAHLVRGVPIAGSATGFLFDRASHVSQDLQDRKAFAAEAANDPFRNTPGQDLLPDLRGKDVMLTFVESYGRSAIEDPGLAPAIDPLLDAGSRKLAAAGLASRSAFLTSPTSGGGSWLAHSTLLSGLWIDNNQRDRELVESNRFTLTGAFQRAGWRTVGIMPGNTAPWPESTFFGYDKVYGAGDLGYRGPKFSWATMPDQYTFSAFERLEHAKANGALMAEVVTVSSHAPWSPLPRPVSWRDVGDGSIFDSMSGKAYLPEAILTRDRERVRADYRRSIEYSLNTLISYVQTYGKDDLVLIFLGDHQPSPVVTGQGASRDVPITIVARDPAVLDRIADWGWQSGLRPGTDAPVWRMDTFRDRFLTAFGSRAATSPTGKR
jgi:hypothetical protein